ncbi:MAG: metallophosphoesterase [Phaeodactylibacter sp.]|nr:metallophosphoesterase [Phaeodactylibacter sp.]
MNIQYCSDLHREFPDNRRWLAANPLIPSAEILVIAGDCFYLGDDYGSYDFIRWAADSFKAVYILPGNHEYYGGYDVATAFFSYCRNGMLNGKPGRCPIS